MGDKPNNSQPAISLPKGGGAIKGIGETFQPNLFSGTGNFSVPIFTSPGRAGFGPQLALQYSTGNGNGSFGLGWQLSIPRITRKTEKGLPKYTDEDVFVMSGAEDLVPKFKTDTTEPDVVTRGEDGNRHTAHRYRPRTEGLFARIEKWVHDDSGDVHWRATTKDNVTSIYGRTSNARISNPDNPDHIFEWLLQETYDAKGNHILYDYAGEDPDLRIESIFEQNRRYSSQRYIRRIYYGNAPAQLEGQELIGPRRLGVDHTNHLNLTPRRYLFEVLFDYGDLGNDDLPEYGLPAADGTLEFTHEEWTLRDDAFSSFRSGFEIRTLRRCRRVLMVHHFKELGDSACIVKSTDFQYCNDDQSCLSLLKSATVTGYRKENGRYKSAAMPPVSFGYSQFQPQKQHYQSLSARNDDLPPFSLKNSETTLVDLFGDGLPDVLNTTQTGYYYWKNLGHGQLDMRHPQHTVPAGLTLSHPGVAFADLGGDGLPDLMVVDEALSGFFEATPDGEWKPFKIIDYPSFGLNDPNVRLLDLTGDGRSDALMTRDHHFLWFECKGEKGYGGPQTVERKRHLDEFPDIYFNDPSGRVRLADMTGDGLNDIVLVHNGRIDYWPNMGYGEFGQRITMKNAPHLEYNFDPGRLFLADLDGSGCTDLVYVDFNEVHFWFNQSGNGWSKKQVIHGTPFVTNLSSVQFADVFGTGTATLVWSYDFDFQPGGNYKALDFCGGVKPYVLTEMDNNMGATTRVQYAPSIKFYLEDKKIGLDWATNLPFPVQVVEKVEVIDHIGKTKLVTTYKYHHGYFDGREREFRGFGRVDQFDTETFDDFTSPGLHGDSDEFINSDRGFHVPPVETRTWFHTGIYFNEDRLIEEGHFFDHHELMDRYRLEYSDKDQNAFRLAAHKFEGIGSEAPHEAYRALRGAVLRSEVFGRDDTDKKDFPYVVTENRYLVKQLQSKNGNHHGVYLTTINESITYHYERNLEDPRIAHQINLEIDPFGNIIESAAIGYPRRTPYALYPEQQAIKATYTWSRFINEDSHPGHYYVGINCETKVFELHGLTWQWPEHDVKPLLVTADDLDSVRGCPDGFRPYHPTIPENIVGLEKRIVDWKRIYFRKDNDPELIDPKGSHAHRLNLGEIGSLGLPYETYQAAFTDDLLHVLYDNRIENVNLILNEEGGYHEEDQYWWIPSGRQNYIEENFFQPLRMQDPFGNPASFEMDCYALVVTKATDAKDNVTQVRMNYRVLKPCELIDPNNNHTCAAFDALGMVVGTAVQGKITNGQAESGDSLSNFQTDLTQEQIDNFFNAEDPHTHAAALLQDATIRIIYDLNRFQRIRQEPLGRPEGCQPVYAATLAREKHAGDLDEPDDFKVQISFSYSDGFGREIQKKVQAEDGTAPVRDPKIIKGADGFIKPGPLVMENGKPCQALTSHRWVGNGRITLNNKGKPIKQYEPFFSSTHLYEGERELTDTGVTPVLFYDPMERLICTLHPNHTYEKVVFDAWQQETWDVNDTVGLEHPVEDPNYGTFFKELPQEQHSPTWYAQRKDGELGAEEKDAADKAHTHANTPTAAHLDILGRPFLMVADNGVYGKYKTHVTLDIEGNDKIITDPRTIEAFKHTFDIAGRKLRIDSVDAGERLTLPNVAGNSVNSWDAEHRKIHTTYDELQRPSKVWVTEGDRSALLAEEIEYGETAPEAVTKSLRTRVYRVYDGAGVVTNEEYDFKGNLISSIRQLASNHETRLNWMDPRAVDLEQVPLRSVTDYDALNRVTKTIVMPDEDDTTWYHYLPRYNEANLLECVKAHLPGRPGPQQYVTNIDYNARGQRKKIQYANGVSIEYDYYPDTFRLHRMVTQTDRGSVLQNLHYTYDPVGNITKLRDFSQQTTYFDNIQVNSDRAYAYDPVYRIIEAKGREHDAASADSQRNRRDFERQPQPNVNLKALRKYTENYGYDASGNFRCMKHSVNGTVKWVRNYEYQSSPRSNRLLETTDSEGQNRVEYRHDANGNIDRMPYLSTHPDLNRRDWDFKNRMIRAELGGGGTAYYQYDGGMQRIRKVIRNGTTVEERVYFGIFEIYRRYVNGRLKRRHETLHILDDQQRIALIENLLEDERPGVNTPTTVARYQLNDHLGSSSIEVDEQGQVITYEEYYPYGRTSYHCRVNRPGLSQKRYRYSGKERDDETGLYYFGARYYSPWLGRWLSCDIFTSDSCNLYCYCRCKPINFRDPDGNQAKSVVANFYRENPGVAEAEVEIARNSPEAAAGALYAVGTIFIEGGKQLWDLEGTYIMAIGMAEEKLRLSTGFPGPEILSSYEHEYSSAIGKMAMQGHSTSDIGKMVLQGVIDTPKRMALSVDQGNAFNFGMEAMTAYMIGRSGLGLTRGTLTAGFNYSVGMAKLLGANVAPIRNLQLKLNWGCPVYNPSMLRPKAGNYYKGQISIGEEAFSPGLTSLWPTIGGSGFSRFRLRVGNLLRGNLLRRTIKHEAHHRYQMKTQGLEKPDILDALNPIEFTQPSNPNWLVGAWNVEMSVPAGPVASALGSASVSNNLILRSMFDDPE